MNYKVLCNFIFVAFNSAILQASFSDAHSDSTSDSTEASVFLFDKEILAYIKENRGCINNSLTVPDDLVIDGQELGVDLVFGENGGFSVFGTKLEFKNIKLKGLRGNCFWSLPSDCCLDFDDEHSQIKEPEIIFNNTELSLSDNFEFPRGSCLVGKCTVLGNGLESCGDTIWATDADITFRNGTFKMESSHLTACSNLKLHDSIIAVDDYLVLDAGLNLEIQDDVIFQSKGDRLIIIDNSMNPIKINLDSCLELEKAFLCNVPSKAHDMFVFADNTSKLCYKDSILISCSTTSFLTGQLIFDGHNKFDVCNEHEIRLGNEKRESDVTINMLSKSSLTLVNGTLSYLNTDED